ncbi:MAG: YceD family protein [Actinomycetota bacterium]|nr:YceD family protein [Actinomycetota bacterium]
MTGLDARNPLVLDVRNLQRTPGSMITVIESVPAPVGLGVALARVPEGSPIDLDLRLESVLEGVLVTGTADLLVSAECSRCLDPVDWHEEIDLTELFRYPATDARGAVVADPDESDDPLPELQDDYLDLGPVLRDAVVLDLPLAPLCREDCPGLCSQCGARLADDPGHAHETTDPRWAALAALADRDE